MKVSNKEIMIFVEFPKGSFFAAPVVYFGEPGTGFDEIPRGFENQ